MRIEGRKEVYSAELPYKVRPPGWFRPWAAVMVTGIRHHQLPHGPAVLHWS